MIGKLTGKHLECFAKAKQKYNVLHGSVSSGKTITSLLMWVFFVLAGPPGELLMVGKTERTLKRNVIDVLITIFGNAIQPSGGECKIYGRRCYLVGANDERAEQKIRGISLVGAYCDEMTLYPESFFQMLKTRLRLPGARLYGTTNPDAPKHYIKTDFIDNEKIKNKTIWHFTLDDNPYLDPDYVQDMKNSFTGLWYRRYILGEWCLAEGVVYDMWDDAKHTYKVAPYPVQDYYVGIDYGTANPTCFLLMGITGNKAICIKEYYYDSIKTNRQKTDAEFAKDLKDFIGDIKIRSIIIDPSAASFRAQLRKDGWFVRDANNDVLDGIRTVSTMLQSGRYLVHESCQNHIAEFSSYVWDAKAQEKGEDKPMKQNDHSMDACRYALHTVMGRGGIFYPKRALQ